LLKIAFEIILGPKERERGGIKAMTTIINERIEFNPQRDILGKTTERNRTSRYHLAGLKGI